jgi:formylglycine-generating enzyme required for sulfatase activity
MTWYDAAIYCNHLSTLGGCDLAYTITVTSADGDHVTSAAVTWNRSTNGYRLLTEAEWEYACRAGSTGAFCNGGISGTDCADVNLDLVGWYCGNASDTTHDVGGKAANAWGLHDMHGNVYEWCWDWYGDYDYPGPVTDPVGPSSGEYRNWRGGGFRQAAQYCRSAFRNPGIPGSRGPGVGLRVARTAE